MVNIRNLKRSLNFWSVTSIIVALLIVVPSLTIFTKVFNRPNDVWYHIKEYLLLDYIQNTIILIVFVGILTILIGVTLSWFITIYDFPFRNFFKWSLILPLAIPPYIAAYTYGGMLSYTGTIQVFFRKSLQINVNQRFFDIMSIEGTIFIFTMTLYPYVYMITRTFLQRQSSSLIESSRLLGKNHFQTFLYVIIPLLKTAIVASVTLVILEVLNDYGVVSYFGVRTFSTAIFTAWFSFGDIDSAVRLSALLMGLVFIIITSERLLRGKRQYSSTTTKIKPIKRVRLTGVRKILIVSYLSIIVGLGFIIPTLQLIRWSIMSYKHVFKIEFIYLTINTISLALLSTTVIVIIAIIIANYNRTHRNSLSKVITKVTMLGYSIPGAVIAIAVLTSFIFLDQHLFPVYKLFNTNSIKLVLTSSLYMLMFAYIIRFMAIGYNAIESSYDKIGSNYSEASYTLGHNKFKTLFKVDLPMIKGGIITAFTIVFIDVLKELPLTLILRPFNYDTLSTKVYQYANDEMIHEASIPSLLIIIISGLAIYFISIKGGKKNGHED